MKETDFETIKFFTGQAMQGLLIANPDIANHPNDLAKKAIKISLAVQDHLAPEEKQEKDQERQS